MAGVATITVTGTAGPGLTVSSGVYNNIAYFTLNPVTAMLEMTDVNDRVSRVSIAAATTITVTLSGAAGNYTVSIT